VTAIYEDVDPKNKRNYKVSVAPSISKDPRSVYEEVSKELYDSWVESSKVTRPDRREVAYYRIFSEEKPVVMAGFFRFYNTKKDQSFTDDEKRIFEKLTPHLCQLIRIIHSYAFQSKAYQYFSTYVEICSKITSTYKLSATENKIMLNLLFGKTNEEIADLNFISIPTVKKHIQHIFKKTGVKSRLEFISSFFTSPEKVKL
jgi:DNA-binding CsgD family transcriptional regulator